MEKKFSGEIQEQETRVGANQIQAFLKDNANAIDSSVSNLIQKDYTFMEKFVTKKGLVKLIDEIKGKRITDVGQFYGLLYKIESDGKLKTASEFVQLKASRISTEFQSQFRKYSDHKLIELNDDTNSTKDKINDQIIKSQNDIEKVKNIDFLYDTNMKFLKKQAEVSFEILFSNYEKFKKSILEEATKYTIDK